MLLHGEKIIILIIHCLLFDSSCSDTCPQPCSCNKDLSSVDCTNRHLITIPGALPIGAREILLDKNAICRVPDKIFIQQRNLSTLRIRQNCISQLDSLSFMGLQKLEILDMTLNKLEKIGETVFQEAYSLKFISLSQNMLTVYPNLSLSPNLSRLILDTNSLSHAVFPEYFRFNMALVDINLSNNPITTINFTHIKTQNINKFACSRCALDNIPQGLFNNFPNLQSLDMSYNSALSFENFNQLLLSLTSNRRLSSLKLSGIIRSSWVITGDTFKPLGNKKLLVLKLSDSKYVTINKASFIHVPSLELLDVHSSSVKSIDDNAFDGLNKLNRLLLNDNVLGEVPKFLPSSLTELDLSNNPLNELFDRAFAGLSLLRNLSLRNCKILKIHTDAFIELSSLYSLDLSQNRLSGNGIGNKILGRMPQLTFLNLAQNNFEKIIAESDVFQDLQELRILDFSSNHCGEVPETIFQSLISLQKLNLNNNLFGNIITTKSKLLKNLFSLTEIYLEHNQISFIPKELFADLKLLQVLRLSSNSLTEWADGVFVPLPMLKNLLLNDNKISVINESSVTGWMASLRVDLSKNPFNCWCDLRWFRQWMNSCNVIWINFDKYTCSSPTQFANMKLELFDPASITDKCTLPPWQLYLFIGIGAVIFFAVISFYVCYRCRWRIRICCFKCKHSRERNLYQQYENLISWKYEIFVSWSEDQGGQAWVERFLSHINSLNQPNCKVFTEREIPPNGLVIEEIGKALMTSCTAIIILSREYLKNNKYRHLLQWVIQEMIHRHGLEFQQYMFFICLNSPGEIVSRLPRIIRATIQNEGSNVFYFNPQNIDDQLIWRHLIEKIKICFPQYNISTESEHGLNSERAYVNLMTDTTMISTDSSLLEYTDSNLLHINSINEIKILPSST